MTHDPEAAWPLTDTTQGYYPTTPSALPPSQVVPYAPVHNSHAKGFTVAPDGTRPSVPHGVRIAFLAIILGVSIPLTAIAISEGGIIGLIIAWAGIIIVSAIAFGFGFRRN